MKTTFWLGALVIAGVVGGCDGASTPADAAASHDAVGPASEDAGMSSDTASADDAASRDDAASAVGCAPGLAADLCFLREEEKLARDVYLALFAQTDIMVFDNISRSEQSHTDAVAGVLVARSIPDPVTDDTPGVFHDPTIAGLYTSLTEAGAAGDVEALRVGATIEDLDLHDIEGMRSRTTEADALALYDTLSCGSRNHMRSFAMQLSSHGVTYEAAYISAEALSAILASPRETCAP